MYHFISQLRKTRDNPKLLLKDLELLPSLVQWPKCSTLQGQSLGYYSRCMTSYRSLQYSTNKKLFYQHLLCHASLSITFAFHGCLRSVKMLNYHSDWRHTWKIWKSQLNFWWKPKCWTRNICKRKWMIWSRFLLFRMIILLWGWRIWNGKFFTEEAWIFQKDLNSAAKNWSEEQFRV